MKQTFEGTKGPLHRKNMRVDSDQFDEQRAPWLFAAALLEKTTMSEITAENYETWCLSKWIFSEKPIRMHWLDTARKCLRQAADARSSETFTWAISREARFHLARELSATLIDENPLHRTGAYWDLLNDALCRVEWPTIAEQLLEAVRQELVSGGSIHISEKH